MQSQHDSEEQRSIHTAPNSGLNYLSARPYPHHGHSAQDTGPSSHGAVEDQAMQPFNYPSHDVGSVSPNEHLGISADPFRHGGTGSGAPSPGHISAMLMHNPKRAYRQRRKDPSCDACRERKVKVSISLSMLGEISNTALSVMPPRRPVVQNARVVMCAVSLPKIRTGACRRSSACFGKSSRSIADTNKAGPRSREATSRCQTTT